MNNKINEVMQSREVTPRGVATVGGAIAGGVGLVMTGKFFFPRANDIIFETFNNNEGWLALGAVGLGVAAIGASRKYDDGRTVKARGHEMTLSRKALTAAGIAMIGFGAISLLDRVAVSESPTAAGPQENSAINVDLASGDGDAPAESQGFTPPGECEIIADFNSEEARQSDRYELDAMRLQYALFERGFFPEGTTLDVAVDGDLRELTGQAVDNLQSSGGLDVSLPWNTETCKLIDAFMDGDPATPAFNERPELRFAA